VFKLKAKARAQKLSIFIRTDLDTLEFVTIPTKICFAFLGAFAAKLFLFKFKIQNTKFKID